LNICTSGGLYPPFSFYSYIDIFPFEASQPSFYLTFIDIAIEVKILKYLHFVRIMFVKINILIKCRKLSDLKNIVFRGLLSLNMSFNFKVSFSPYLIS